TQGKPLGHVWADATYTNPETCTLCGATQGEILYVETFTHEGLKYQLNQDKTGYVVTGYTEERTQYEILSSAYFLPVVEIGNRAFYDCTSLTNINIPDSITSIGNGAFFECRNLTSIALPSSLTSIANYAFYACTNLASIDLPDSITSIGSRAFSSCYSLTSIDLPDSITSIGNSAFLLCFYLTSIKIPDSLTSIGDYAFQYCESLTSIVLPDSLTSIGDYAFSGCYRLVEVYNYSALEIVAGSSGHGNVANYAVGVYTSNVDNKLWTDEKGFTFFEDDENCYLAWYDGTATDLVLPNSCNGKNYGIRRFAFDDSMSIRSITLPDGVTSIGDYAFSECRYLTSIVLPDSITSIGNSAFSYCYDLTSIDLPDSLTSIGNYAFRDCHDLTSIDVPDSITSIGTYAFATCTSLASIDLPDSLTSIGAYAFSLCHNLISITIPSSLTTIGNNAFSGCYRLAEVYNFSSLEIEAGSTEHGAVGYYALAVHTENVESKLWTDENGFTFFEDGEKCYLVRYNGSETELVLPESCHGKNYAINSYAFYDNNTLTSITLSESITSIDDSAFRSCSNLININIPSGIATIGNYAFDDCTRLTSLTIPNSVTTIGDYTFYGCTSLTSITIPSSVTSIGDYTFYECTSLTSITFPEGITSIGDGAFSHCTGLTSITFPKSLISIGYSAFYGCRSLEEVVLHNVEELGFSAFAYCTSLRYVDLGNALERITRNMDYPPPFYRCTSLEIVLLPDTLKNLEPNTFNDCTNLKCLKIPRSIISIAGLAIRFVAPTSKFVINLPIYLEDDSNLQLNANIISILLSQRATLNDDFAVYYLGTPEDWQADPLSEFDLPCPIYFYSETEPNGESEYTYWHYIENVPYVWGYVPESE
ncbi:MAG: leucine-rich repeat domain-containing protein, partial [Clostridia bacterium]|nr:leucine-rich repeat domain-containing protein [Clostridia bacterium]